MVITSWAPSSPVILRGPQCRPLHPSVSRTTARLPAVHQSIKRKVWYNIPTPIPSAGDPGNAQWHVEFGHKEHNAHDMDVTLDYFETLVRSEVENGTPANRIVFLGDSQGAGMVVLFLQTRRLAADLGAIISYAGFHPTDLQTVR
ncbi:hypothetical protein D0Z07_6106 [Hyphodiscus hymeniophilus]|uniref:Phospholipase/carboxylesterase/thioesterase domain-containing protein n=1 Tax=Hyphodiscus hymeniophilus TaxID=353542 RepID=A0A9P6VF67_9HELO|nr:hypothetical protein D0Z07_6106 [Hyphodiscus hymeniophilus]